MLHPRAEKRRAGVGGRLRRLVADGSRRLLPIENVRWERSLAGLAHPVRILAETRYQAPRCLAIDFVGVMMRADDAVARHTQNDAIEVGGVHCRIDLLDVKVVEPTPVVEIFEPIWPIILRCMVPTAGWNLLFASTLGALRRDGSKTVAHQGSPFTEERRFVEVRHIYYIILY